MEETIQTTLQDFEPKPTVDLNIHIREDGAACASDYIATFCNHHMVIDGKPLCGKTEDSSSLRFYGDRNSSFTSVQEGTPSSWCYYCNSKYEAMTGEKA